MPKQKINYTTPEQTGEARFDLTVGWRHDSDIQVGIETRPRADGQHHLVDQIYGDDQSLTQIGRPLIEWAQYNGATFDAPLNTDEQKDDFARSIGRMALDAVTGSTPFGTGVYWHPNRHMVNDLIRTLRRARDAAFGADA